MSNVETLTLGSLMETSGVQFGTSGARGLVAALTDRVCYAYARAFLQHLSASGQLGTATRVALAGDLRSSTPRILEAVARGVVDSGLTPVFCGPLPTPALTCYGLSHAMPSLMITGSHIPDDRNGIKFNTARGEITKADEAGIRAQAIALPAAAFAADGAVVGGGGAALPAVDDAARRLYVARFLDFFPPGCLAGMRIGLYEHSTVGRELFAEILGALGAEVVPLARSERFVSVDTEAIRPEDVRLAREWAAGGDFTAIVSADGDADRPLVSDEHGRWLRGDVAGILCARYLGADTVVTPVSSNSAVERCGAFNRVVRTRIGSPHVIEAMLAALAAGSDPVVGYEANGGFLTASDLIREGRRLPALPTRDALLVPIALLCAAAEAAEPLSALVAALPARFTASDRLQAFPPATARDRIGALVSGEFEHDRSAIESLFGALCGRLDGIDTTDGARFTFANGEVIHLRPSGNAPELRCYNEADSAERAAELNGAVMKILESWRPLGS